MMLYIYAKRIPTKDELPDPVTTAKADSLTTLLAIAAKYSFKELYNAARSVLIEVVAWGLEDGPLCTEAVMLEILSLMVTLQHEKTQRKSKKLGDEIAKWVFQVMRRTPAQKVAMEALVFKYPTLGLQLVSVSMEKLDKQRAMIEVMDK